MRRRVCLKMPLAHRDGVRSLWPGRQHAKTGGSIMMTGRFDEGRVCFASFRNARSADAIINPPVINKTGYHKGVRPFTVTR